MISKSQDLVFTGERFVPEIRGDIELEHLHRYLLACELCNGQTVLDIASGEGYGSAILSSKAARVFGVDISTEAVAHAQTRYGKENLEFIVGNCADIPLPDASIDVVVSFETIEHHDQHQRMLQEIKRVLKPAGILIISSPDKHNYSDKPGYNNPYHIKELYESEFKVLINSYFKKATYFGQRIIYGSAIFAETLPTTDLNYWHEDEAIKKVNGVSAPTYWIAIACDKEILPIATGIFEQPIQEVDCVIERDREIAQLRTLHTNLQTAIYRKQQELDLQGQYINDFKTDIEKKQKELDLQGRFIEEFKAEISTKQSLLNSQHQFISELQSNVTAQKAVNADLTVQNKTLCDHLDSVNKKLDRIPIWLRKYL